MREELQLVTVEQIVSDPQAYENKMVKVGGWVRSNRDSKSIGFIVLGDGSCFTTLQIVYEDRIASFASAAKLGAGTAIIAEGTIVLTPDARQPFEMHAENIEVEGASTPDYPM